MHAHFGVTREVDKRYLRFVRYLRKSCAGGAKGLLCRAPGRQFEWMGELAGKRGDCAMCSMFGICGRSAQMTQRVCLAGLPWWQFKRSGGQGYAIRTNSQGSGHLRYLRTICVYGV